MHVHDVVQQTRECRQSGEVIVLHESRSSVWLNQKECEPHCISARLLPLHMSQEEYMQPSA
jgi:hypothetical protein